ncbi:hypothetical protein BDY19DRAFT_584807 [Irpex rosettiformis]|uniref:Uncharacterized protein n=1 Tax=Irpex rosettiformis TaxID=378272 RepID=A0ACB8UCX5_9APHY|nr:hypothetical protein BDY19DRAFT_584807 [Irpex rosettiformis]
MVRYSILPVTALFLAASSVHAGRNDWSKACHGGECSYDLTGRNGGSISIAGAPNAISDITTAGGWTILNCKPDTRVQDIRVICTDRKCNHLYNGHGAVNTIVRLPESCTDAPFARVAKEWKHSDQSVPDHVLKAIKRDRSASVRGLSLDTNFSAVDPNVTGNVTFVIAGASQSGDTGNFTETSAIASRGFFSDLGDALKSLNTVTFNKDAAYPITFDKSVTIVDQSISCPQTGSIPAFNGDFKIAGEAKVDATLDFAVAATGTIIPPKLTGFGLVSELDGRVDGLLTVTASAGASLTIAKKNLLTIGIPGLSVAGILTIGPAFVVSASAVANLNAQANFDVDLAYILNGARLEFPPSVGSSGGVFSPGDMSLNIAATPNAAVNGNVEAHLIPAATFGVNAFDGDATAEIDLTVDTYGKLDLSLTAQGSASAGTSGSSASGSFNGCVDVNAGLAVTAGANAQLFNIFDKSTSVTLYQKNFDVFSKCFSGSQSTKKDSILQTREHARDIKKRGLTCPTIATGVSTVASQVVSAAKISPK